jgi:hypothetical protein
MLLFVCSVLRHINDGQLFLQPQLISHTQHVTSQLQNICIWSQRRPLKDPSISQFLL